MPSPRTRWWSRSRGRAPVETVPTETASTEPVWAASHGPATPRTIRLRLPRPQVSVADTALGVLALVTLLVLVTGTAPSGDSTQEAAPPPFRLDLVAPEMPPAGPVWKTPEHPGDDGVGQGMAQLAAQEKPLQGPDVDRAQAYMRSARGIPAVALTAYRAAAQAMSRSDPSCHLPWSVLAAIGRVESDHGRFGGSMVRDDGSVAPPVLGRVLDGNGVARIGDSDGGRLDGDTRFDRAVGPMQFIPASWAAFGADGNGDGRTDPHNLFDAALAAARYLCAGPGDLSHAGDLRAAVLRYNHSQSYADHVIGLAEAYASGTPVTGPPPAMATPPSVPTAAPTTPVSPTTPDRVRETLPGAPSPATPGPVGSPPQTSPPTEQPTEQPTEVPPTTTPPTTSTTSPTTGPTTGTGSGTSSATSGSSTGSATSSTPPSDTSTTDAPPTSDPGTSGTSSPTAPETTGTTTTEASPPPSSSAEPDPPGTSTGTAPTSGSTDCPSTPTDATPTPTDTPSGCPTP